MDIGIIGYGFVGKAIEAGFQYKCLNIHINDPGYPISCPYSVLKDLPFVFVCVPTPMATVEGGSCDPSILYSVLDELVENEYKGEVIIKSTIPPNVAAEIECHYALRIVVCPEFLLEKDAVNSFIHMDSLVVGSKYITSAQEVVMLYDDYSICNPKRKTIVLKSCAAASLVKYMKNSFLAMKVIFMNQFNDLYKALDIPDQWDRVVEAFHHDSRMGNSHGSVPGHDGDYGFGGKCFPKDINAIIALGEEYTTQMSLLEETWRVNKAIRSNWDWATIEGAVSSLKMEEE